MFWRAGCNSAVRSEVNTALSERLCVCGQGTPFYVLCCLIVFVIFKMLVIFIDTPPFPPTPTHPAGPAHLAGMSRMRDNLFAQQPHVCAF